MSKGILDGKHILKNILSLLIFINFFSISLSFFSETQHMIILTQLIKLFNLILILCIFFLMIKLKLYIPAFPSIIILAILFYLFISAFNSNFINVKVVVFLVPISLFFIFSMMYGLKEYIQHKSFFILEVKFIKLLSIFLFFPIILYFIGFQEFFIDSDLAFKGFSGQHNNYGFHIVLLSSLIFLRKRSINYYFYLLPIYIGLFLSESRSMTLITSLLIIFNFIYIQKIKIRYIILSSLFFVLIGLLFTLFSDRSFSGSNYGRVLLVNSYLNKINEDIFFGHGGYYTVSIWKDNINAHNFFLQTMADYGLIVTALYTYLFIYLFFKTTWPGRIIIISIFIVAMTQPYFMFQFLYGPIFLLLIWSFSYTYQNKYLKKKVQNVN